MSEIFKTKTIKKNQHAEPGSSGRRRSLENYKTAMGMMCNWADLDTGIMYHIQDYAEAMHDPKIPADKKPTKIKMTRIKDGTEIGWLEPELVAEKMKDPEPDPRY